MLLQWYDYCMQFDHFRWGWYYYAQSYDPDLIKRKACYAHDKS